MAKKKKNNKLYNKIANEVDTILNQSPNSCYYFFNEDNNYSINGSDDILKIFDFTYLIPNLFRKCYIYKTLSVPNICVNCINGTLDTITKYLPILLDESIIKSFLYFNFPVNIKYYSKLNSYISSVVNYRTIIDKKAKTITYGAITPSTLLYNYVYSNNSMLTNLIKFNVILNNQKAGCPYYVPWDYTTGCYITENKYSAIVEEFIVGVFNDNNIISQTTIDLLSYLRYTFFNNFSNTNINYNEILLMFRASIYKILKYAQEVYTDILNMYDSILRDVEYCIKDYMNISNIPILIELYNNFYNNQLFTNSKNLPVSVIQNVVPVTSSISNLILKFITYYNNAPNLGVVFNSVILNNNEGIVFCSSQRTYNYLTINRSSYSYYYLNTNSTGATQLYNYWGITGNVPIYTNSSGLLPNNGNKYNNQFPINFFNGVTGTYNIKSYLSIVNGATAQYDTTYSNGGVYDVIYGYNKSISYTGPVGGSSYFCNGETYFVYNDSSMTSLNSKVYLTFETSGTTGAGVPVGVGLPIVYYPQISNLIVYPL